jgi:SAM-dependent methyltransferase
VALGENGFDDFLEEKHHHQYGRPWCVGRSYFDYLLEIGLRPDHRVLDFGCGAGRVGIWLIGYLDRGRYFGIDSHLSSLEAFARYEIPLHALGSKHPRLAHDDRFALTGFGERFDYVLDLYVSSHLKLDRALDLYGKIAAILAPGGRIVLPHEPVVAPPQLAEMGLAVERTDERPSFLLAHSKHDLLKDEAFHVLRAVNV